MWLFVGSPRIDIAFDFPIIGGKVQEGKVNE